MKDFVISHKKIIIFLAIIIVLIMIFTTTEIAVTTSRQVNSVDDINTCSIPAGKIKAKGIDVSRYQGTIDFNKVKSDGYSFVIIRVGTSQGGKDANFDTYYKNAKDAGLDLGVIIIPTRLPPWKLSVKLKKFSAILRTRALIILCFSTLSFLSL